MKLLLETRPAYAYVAATGSVGISEAASLRETAGEQARTHDSMRLLLDLRDAEVTREARDAILAWARAPHANATAMVTLDELFVAEVNMAALATGARVRGFGGSSDAHRWLTRGSMAKTPFDGGSSRPPPIDAATRRAALLGQPLGASERPRTPSGTAFPAVPRAPTATSERPTQRGMPRPKRDDET